MAQFATPILGHTNAFAAGMAAFGNVPTALVAGAPETSGPCARGRSWGGCLAAAAEPCTNPPRPICPRSDRDRGPLLPVARNLLPSGPVRAPVAGNNACAACHLFWRSADRRHGASPCLGHGRPCRGLWRRQLRALHIGARVREYTLRTIRRGTGLRNIPQRRQRSARWSLAQNIQPSAKISLWPHVRGRGGT